MVSQGKDREAAMAMGGSGPGSGGSSSMRDFASTFGMSARDRSGAGNRFKRMFT